MKNTKSVIVYFVSLLLFSHPIYSTESSNTIDSLKLVLKRLSLPTQTVRIDNDTVYLSTLNSLSWALIDISDFENSIKYANEAIALAEKLPNSLEKVKKRNLSKSYNNIGVIYWYQGDYAKALEQHLKSLKLKEEIGDKEGVSMSFQNMGLTYKNQGNYSKAFEMYINALKIRREIEEGDPNNPRVKKGIAGILLSIGSIYENQGDYSKALEYDFKSSKIYEELNEKKGISASSNNIGHLYQNQGDYSKALEQYLRSLKINEEIGNKSGIARSINNIACIYVLQNNNSKALEQYFMSLKIEEELGAKGEIANTLTNIGSVYGGLGEYEKALEMDFKALKINEEIGDKEGIAFSSNNIGSVNFALKKFQEADKYLNNALFLSKEIGSKKEMKFSYRALAELDSARGNYMRAFQNYKMYVLYSDSLLNEASIKKTVQLKMQYDFDKKETIAKAQQDKKDVLTAKQKQVRDIIIGSFILVFFFSLVTLRNFWQKQKAIMRLKESEIEFNKKMFQNEIQAKEKELDHNKSKLLVYTGHLVEKNALLEELNARLKELEGKNPEDQEKIKKINQLASSKIITEDNWDQFKNLFGKVHEGFFNKLKHEYPGITTAESRLAALIKLNISSKEIASMIGISDDSVKKTRQRLRKKMQLETVDGLEETIFKM